MMLYYINNVKREESRAKRIEEIITAAKENRLLDRFYSPSVLAKRKSQSAKG